MNLEVIKLYKKQIITGGIIIFLIIVISIVGVVLKSIYRQGKVEVLVQYAPFSAEVTIGDKVYKNNAIHFLEPGEYQISVTHTGFDSFEDIVTINDDTKELYGMLEANSPEGKEIAKRRSQDFIEVEGIYGREANEEGMRTAEEWPLVGALPYHHTLYSLGYTDHESVFTITVRSQREYVNSAIDKLKEIAKTKNDNLDRYDISFTAKLDIFPDTNAISGERPQQAAQQFLEMIPAEKGSIDGTYSDDGRYYIAKFYVGDLARSQDITYRVILTKTLDRWQIVSGISPVINQYNSSSIPESVRQQANDF